MQKVRAANPDALFMTGVLTPENALILRSYRQLGLKTPVLGNYNLSIPVYSSVAKGLLDGVVFVDAFDPAKAETKPLHRRVQEGHRQRAVQPQRLRLRRPDAGGRCHQARRQHRQGQGSRCDAGDQGLHVGVMGGVGAIYGFADGKRTGFDPNGMVVRVYEGDKQGKVVHVGAK
jgi:branched-chain amino acid transport system substrate-binding protein